MKRIIFLPACILLVTLFYFSCYAQALTSAELINNAKQYDAKTVVFKGEVVGDIMIRGEYAWLSVNDGYNAIGIWINKELIKDIRYVGGYKAKGDIVEVSGMFRRSCPEHGGDLDLHAHQITKIISGEPIYRDIDVKRAYVSVLLFIAASLAYLLRKFITAQKKTA